jgi:hypothetical protein
MRPRTSAMNDQPSNEQTPPKTDVKFEVEDWAPKLANRAWCPEWQNLSTLCKSLKTNEKAIDYWIRNKLLPPPHQIGEKQLWKWSEVETFLARRRGDAGAATTEPEAGSDLDPENSEKP